MKSRPILCCVFVLLASIARAHVTYVVVERMKRDTSTLVKAAANKAVAERFLLRADADRLIADATASDILK